MAVGRVRLGKVLLFVADEITFNNNVINILTLYGSVIC